MFLFHTLSSKVKALAVKTWNASKLWKAFCFSQGTFLLEWGIAQVNPGKVWNVSLDTEVLVSKENCRARLWRKLNFLWPTSEHIKIICCALLVRVLLTSVRSTLLSIYQSITECRLAFLVSPKSERFCGRYWIFCMCRIIAFQITL